MPSKLRHLFKGLRSSNNQIAQGEAKFQAIIKYAGDAIFIIDPSFHITDTNESACKLLGYSAEELREMKIYELMTADDQQSFLARAKIVETEGGSLHERKLKRKDGSLVDTEVNVRPVEGVGYISIIRDISERKNTEAKILERESLLTAVFDNMEASLALYDVNKKIVLFNNRFADNYKLLTNQDPKAGDGAHDFLSEEMRKEPSKMMDDALKGNKGVFEKEYLSNGKFTSFRTSFNPVINDGKITGITSFSLDLTKSKEAEIKIRENEEKFRLSFMTSRDAFYIGTLEEGRIIDVNDSFYDLFGYTRWESIGKTSSELKLFIYPEERARMVAGLKADGNLKDVEFTCRKKSGELMIVSVTVNLWQLNNEQVIMAVIRDITESKKIEKELVESQDRLREVLENSLSASYKRNLQTNTYTYLSPVFKKIVGYTQDEMNSMPLEVVIEMMHPDDVQVVKDGLTNGMSKPSGSANSLEYRFKHKTGGGYRWLQDDFVVIHDERGQAVALIGSVSDITERKESELNFKNLVEKSLVGVYIIQNGKYVYVNPRFTQYLGYTQEEMLDMDDVRQIVDNDYVPPALEQWRKKVEAGIIEDFHIELKYKRKDRATIWAEVYCGETFHKGAKAIIGSFQDITERKNAEAVIKEQAEIFSAIIENANESIYLLSPDLKVLQFNKTAKDRILQNTGKEIYLGANFKDFFHVGTESVFMPIFKNAIAGKYTELESCQANIHGEMFWLRTKMYPVYDTRRKLIGVTVLTENISERKKADETIKQSEANYRQLFDNSPAPMWVIDERTAAIIQVNQAAIKNYGYSEQEFSGMAIRDISPNEPDLASKTNMNDMFFMGSNRHVKKSGELIDVITSSIPVRLNGEKSILMTGIDVTEKNLYEQKLAKAAIKAQEDERYEIGGELHDNVCQMLAGSLMLLGVIKASLPESSIEYFDQAYQHINAATDEIRNLSHRLAPVFFNEETLKDALRGLLKTFNVENKYTISLTVDNKVNERPLSRDLQLNLYRILQEQLRNIMKHAKATNITVGIIMKDDNLQMRIADNGIGFDVKANKGGIGLANMNRRAQLFSGSFRINSSEGNGCKITVDIPLSNTDQ